MLWGSSPRMRGARLPLYKCRPCQGIIPADAGSTALTDSGLIADEDHPRGCGEHQQTGAKHFSEAGSSPRMRGALLCVLAHPGDLGIIPADAGSTAPPCPRSPGARDHPRGCGEHLSLQDGTKTLSGSSPRMRGALSRLICASAAGGIIPADAGSTRPHNPDHARRRDHPRGCGEHLVADNPREYVEGSSPRMRGARLQQRWNNAREGIIPADAGSTVPGGRSSSPTRDHPRGCGEHARVVDAEELLPGSSPRMRGALLCGSVSIFVVGIIPADAGSTPRYYYFR